MYDRARNLGCHDNDDCHGGYRQVGAAYVDELCPRMAPPIDEPLTADEERLNDDLMRHNRQRRAALANTVYPCPACNPDQYLRWIDGDWPRMRPVSTKPDTDTPARIEPPARADIDG